MYLWDRIPRTESGEVANRFYAPPDIAIEIVSPEQSVNGLVGQLHERGLCRVGAVCSAHGSGTGARLEDGPWRGDGGSGSGR